MKLTKRPLVILTDIEGTVTPIDFVHQVLFGYASLHLADYVREREDDSFIKSCLAETLTTLREEGEPEAEGTDRAIQALLHWTRTDRKHPALKQLQGRIWKEGYEAGAFVSALYPEVADELKRWKADGIRLAVYSSGSTEAQILLFRHTQDGDLTPLFEAYYDTSVGMKREADSYRTIVSTLHVGSATDVLFLSDVPAELSAAAQAGMQALHVVRPGTATDSQWPSVTKLTEIEF